MKLGTTILILAIVAGAALLAGTRVAESQSADREGIRVAVVDVGRILAECPRALRAEESYRTAASALRASLRDRARKNAQGRADLKLLVAGTEKHELREIELDEEAWRIDYDGERGLRRIESERTRRIRALLTAMGDEVRNLALKRGYDLVLARTGGMGELIDLSTLNQVLGFTATRGVLFGADGLDITNEILKAL
jgi:Skp family chaperone for outer membrane proteins